MDPLQSSSTRIETGCEGELLYTSNIYLAATVLVGGGTLVYDKCDRTDPRRIKLCIRGEKLDETLKAWWDGSSLFRQYSEKLRDIREIIRPVEVKRANSA